MDQTVMLPEVTGKTESSMGKDRRVLETVHWGGNRWIIKLSHYSSSDEVPYQREALVLYTPELDELTRWWSEVKKAVK